MDYGEFKDYVKSLFVMKAEDEVTEPVKGEDAELDAVTVDEVKEVAEQAAELASDVAKNYLTEDDVKVIVADVVAETVSQLKMQAEEYKKLEGKNLDLEERLIKMEAELSRPASAPTKVAPTSTEDTSKHFSMVEALRGK